MPKLFHLTPSANKSDRKLILVHSPNCIHDLVRQDHRKSSLGFDAGAIQHMRDHIIRRDDEILILKATGSGGGLSTLPGDSPLAPSRAMRWVARDAPPSRTTASQSCWHAGAKQAWRGRFLHPPTSPRSPVIVVLLCVPPARSQECIRVKANRRERHRSAHRMCIRIECTSVKSPPRGARTPRPNYLSTCFLKLVGPVHVRPAAQEDMHVLLQNR